jgi:hypothetical protein
MKQKNINIRLDKSDDSSVSSDDESDIKNSKDLISDKKTVLTKLSRYDDSPVISKT